MNNNLLKKILTNFYKKMSLSPTYKERIDDLRRKGLKLGKNVRIHSTASIDSNFCYLISIGDNSMINRGVRLLAHDSTIFLYTGGYGKLGRINIKENCIIGNYSIILPGVTIGPNVLVATGSVVNKNVPPNTCVAGVPARFYSSFDDYIKRERENIKNSYVVDGRKLLNVKVIDKELINEIIKKTEKNIVYMNNLFEIRRVREGSIYKS